MSKPSTLRVALGQERELHLARDFELGFEPLLLDELLVEHRLLDDDGDLRGEEHEELLVVLGVGVRSSDSRSKTPMTESFEMMGATTSERVSLRALT